MQEVKFHPEVDRPVPRRKEYRARKFVITVAVDNSRGGPPNEASLLLALKAEFNMDFVHVVGSDEICRGDASDIRAFAGIPKSKTHDKMK